MTRPQFPAIGSNARTDDEAMIAGRFRSRQLPLLSNRCRSYEICSPCPPHRHRTLSDVPGHPIGGAVGRSESTLAFSIGLLRIIGNLSDVRQRLTPVSFAGGTSGIARFHHLLPVRTLGAFVPTKSPFFRTVTGYTLSVLHIHIHRHGPLSNVPGHPIGGAVGRSESTLAFSIGLLRIIGNLSDVGQRLTPVSFVDGTSGIRPVLLDLTDTKAGSFRSDQQPLLSYACRIY